VFGVVNMTENYIEILKSRLARGEISLDEFEKVASTLNDSLFSGAEPEAFLGKAPLIEVDNKKLGHIALYEDHIKLGNTVLAIADIASFEDSNSVHKINGGSVMRRSSFYLSDKRGNTYSVHEERVFRSEADTNHAKVRGIADTLKKKTFARRMNALVTKIRQLGMLRIGIGDHGSTPVLLDKNGTITCGAFSGTLRNAKTLVMGTRNKGLLASANYDPKVITFSEEQVGGRFDLRDTLFGRARNSLQFHIEALDTDITAALLDWLRDPNNRL